MDKPAVRDAQKEPLVGRHDELLEADALVLGNQLVLLVDAERVFWVTPVLGRIVVQHHPRVVEFELVVRDLGFEYPRSRPRRRRRSGRRTRRPQEDVALADSPYGMVVAIAGSFDFWTPKTKESSRETCHGSAGTAQKGREGAVERDWLPLPAGPFGARIVGVF